MTFVVNSISPDDVHKTIVKHLLADGFPLVVSLEKSHGSWMVDAKTGKEYLDFFSYFSSDALGHNHKVFHREDVEKKLLLAARTKVANSDIYSELMAEFIDTFERVVGVPELPNYFFISGGSAAVENGMKTAQDFKARLNGWSPDDERINKLQIMHLTGAFHGRGGFPLTTTNTDRNKTDYFPKFDWARITAPALKFPLTPQNLEDTKKLEKSSLEQMEINLKTSGEYIAAILCETIQGEGGNNLFSKEFLQGVRSLCDKYNTLFLLDEVQAGTFTTGKAWAFQHYDVIPDICIFGKKMQACGIMVSDRIHQVKDNVFQKSSRINSTWGDDLVCFVRATYILETIVNENLAENVRLRSHQLIEGLNNLQDKYKCLSNVRGLGFMTAVDLPSTEIRDAVIENCYKEQMIILPCGNKSIRFRPSLTIPEECIAEGLKILQKSLDII